MKRKLNSSKGSAILIAFLALLVVAVVSTLVITAASASAGRVGYRTKRQQLMLAANSAAELLANEYSHMTPAVYTQQSDGWKAPELSVPYGKFLGNSVGDILIGPGEKSGTFEISFTDPPETMEGVVLSANLKMKGSAVNVENLDTAREAFYTVLTITAENGKDSYSISLILTPSVQERPKVDGMPSFSLQWYVGEITKGTFTSQKDA